VVEKLLNHHKRSVMDDDEKGNTPLHLACEGGHYEVVKMLVQEKSFLNDK